MASSQTTSSSRPDALQRAEELASTLPPLLVAAERVASTVAQGVHGRRRIGQGDAFWQYRAYQPGDTTQPVSTTVQKLWGNNASLTSVAPATSVPSATPDVRPPQPLDLFSDRSGTFSS